MESALNEMFEIAGIAEFGECVTCRDNPAQRVCWHGLGMWACVRHDPATGYWVDLHGHAHVGHKVEVLPATKFQVIVIPYAGRN